MALLAEMKARCLQGDLITYNSTISACEGLPSVAEDLVAEMKSAKIQVDVVTFNACISSCEPLRASVH